MFIYNSSFQFEQVQTGSQILNILRTENRTACRTGSAKQFGTELQQHYLQMTEGLNYVKGNLILQVQYSVNNCTKTCQSVVLRYITYLYITITLCGAA